jgi:pimeloyl-ACP methyl ester carboxylesterase
MYIDVHGHKTYGYTGGKPFDAAKPTVVFIHGVLNDHSIWILQTRYFAHHGWNVLAPDLPGHCKSAGAPPASVEEAARFIRGLLDATGVEKAVLVGHSFGSLIALELAGRSPDRVNRLVMVGTAVPMKVTPTLLDLSLNEPLKAIDMVNVFSHSMLAPPPSTLGPGTWLYGGSKALMRRVLNSNNKFNLFHTGFKACDDYAGGDSAMERVSCEVLFLLGRNDQMTSPKVAQAIIRKAKNAQTVIVEAGHQLMTEAPDAVLFALKDFLSPPATGVQAIK